MHILNVEFILSKGTGYSYLGARVIFYIELNINFMEAI